MSSAMGSEPNKRARMDSFDLDDQSEDDGSYDAYDANDDSETTVWNIDPNRLQCKRQDVPRKKPKRRDFKIISTWNFKGGVGKTTTTFALGYALANQGKRVMFVDADPQMNLTESAMSFEVNRGDPDEDIFQRLTKIGVKEDIYTAMSKVVYGHSINAVPIVDLMMVESGSIDVQNEQNPKDPVATSPGKLFLLPGSMNIADFDEQIGKAYHLRSDNSWNCPGAFYQLISVTARYHEIDYVLVDVSPAVGHLNRCILFSSHAFIMPCRADAFSRQAIRVLTEKLPEWFEDYSKFRENARSDKNVRNIKYHPPEHNVKFGGYIVVGYDYKKDYAVGSRATIVAINKLKESMLKFLDNLPNELQADPATLNVLDCPQSQLVVKFPMFYQLGLIAQRASIPAPYLPNMYLQVLKGTKWVPIDKKGIIATKENRKRQRQMIEQLVEHLNSILGLASNSLEVRKAMDLEEDECRAIIEAEDKALAQHMFVIRLALLSTYDEALAKLSKWGCVSILLSYIRDSHTVEIQQIAAFTIANIARLYVNRVRMVSDGIIVKLQRISTNSKIDPEVKLHIQKALDYLYSYFCHSYLTLFRHTPHLSSPNKRKQDDSSNDCVIGSSRDTKRANIRVAYCENSQNIRMDEHLRIHFVEND